jgi:hypothetical protein
MKCCGFIFAFYLILLSAVPCCIYDDCAGDKTELAASHDNEDKDCGNCSPFFSCEGCACASIVFDPNFPENVTANTTLVFPDYIQSSLPDVDFDFWQPPKLS